MIDFGLQSGPYGAAQGNEHALSLARVKQEASGIDLGPLRSQLPERLFTPDKMIHCDAPLALSDLQRLSNSLTQMTASTDMVLIGRRHVRSNNSWMHNFHRLVKGKDRCTLQMHPADLDLRQLADGDWVSVTSRVGELKVQVESTSDMLQGVVSLPHGWGHDRGGVNMQIANRHAGVSCNDLTDELYIDELSGNAAVNAVPVVVAAAK
jgi:anaerobic selenocysteine-containing dehydrogenase